jgi:polar amino acid transport system substrate-binding protein
MNIVAKLAVACGLSLFVCGAAHAQTTLEKILSSGKIRIAVDVASPPFGVLNKEGQPDGSEVAVAKQLAKDMGVELELVQVPAPGRIPALVSGRVDTTISSISMTIERAKAVMFANPNGALEITIFGPKNVAVKTPQDLVGKRIGLTRATLEEVVVPKMAPKGATIMWFDEISATIQAMLTGQVDVISMSGFAEKAVIDGNPGKAIERKLLVTTAYYSPVVRQGDVTFLQFLNTWIFVNTHNGVLARIYKEYTGVDLPPLPVQ